MQNTLKTDYIGLWNRPPPANQSSTSVRLKARAWHDTCFIFQNNLQYAERVADRRLWKGLIYADNGQTIAHLPQKKSVVYPHRLSLCQKKHHCSKNVKKLQNTNSEHVVFFIFKVTFFNAPISEKTCCTLFHFVTSVRRGDNTKHEKRYYWL